MTERTRRLRSTGTSLTVPAVAVALCLLAAACGGSGSGAGVAELPTTTAGASTTTARAATTQAARERALLGFSKCMRSHGVPGFPDPSRNADGTYGFGSDVGVLRRLVRGDQKALDSCQALLARSGVLSPQNLVDFQQRMVSFSRCMRSHGEPGFPDPNGNGRFGGRLKTLDPSGPQFQKALTACRPELSAAIDAFSVGGGSG